MEENKNETRQQNTRETPGTTLLLEMEYADESIGSSGTAFFVADDKIATNCHLLLETTTVIAKHIEADVICTVEGIMAFDTENDLAILKISDEGTSFQLGDSDRAQPGEPVYVLGYPGYPEEEKRSKAEGTLIDFLNRGKRIWFKAPVRPGYSGGPMLNGKGEVIAVHHGSKNISGDEGLAIPSNTLKALLTEAQGAKVEPLSAWQKRRDVLIVTVYKLYGCGKWHKRAIVMLRLAWHVIKGFCYLIRANIKTDAEDYARVITIYDKIIASKLVPFLGAAYAYRGMTKSEFGNYQDAIEDANAAISFDPKSYNGYYSRGYVNQVLGKSKADQGDVTEAEKLYQAAINDCTEAINLKPERAKIYNTRGWAKYLFGQLETEQGNETAAQNLYQEAISDADEALHLQPKIAKFRSDTYHTRGAAKAALDDHKAAIEDFNESIRLNPKETVYYHDRGLAKEALGQHEAAKADFAKAKELDPDFENTLDTKHKR